MKKVILFAVVVAVLFFWIGRKTEAQQKQRLEIHGVVGLDGSSNIYYRVFAICDTANGAMLYTKGGIDSEIKLLPNGCSKSP